MNLEVARARLRSLRALGPPLASPVDVVRWLVASQAQDPAGARWSLALRTRAATDAEVDRACDDGAILRTHVLRPTWHFVLPDDVRWLLALTAPRVHAQNAHRYRALGLDAATRTRATDAIARALEGGRALTRDDLRAVLARGRIAADGQRMAHILMHAELEAVIVSGPRRGKQPTHALLAERAPRARTLSRAEALAELATRFLASRAPATAHDLAKWANLTLVDARAAIAAAGPPPRAAASRRAAGPVAHLLSIYDEVVSSYRDRSAMVEARDARRLVGQGNALTAVLLLDGQICGTWKRALAKGAVEVDVRPFRPLTAAQARAVAATAARYARFLGDGVDLDLVIRGRSSRASRSAAAG